MSEFDLDRCMKDGGKCLAGDRPARVICTDRDNEPWPLIVLVRDEDGEGVIEYTRTGRMSPTKENAKDLRNLPEYKEVEVTLLLTQDGTLRASVQGEHFIPDNWKPYGPPVKVRFER